MTKKKISWIEYIFTHLIPTWFQSFGGNFRIWKDLMTGNYKDYALMWYDDPYEECYEWFWTSINMDEVLGKDFLEHLQQMVDDIDKGTVKTYSLDEVMEQLNKLEEEEWE
jgi:hypothetical protein